MREEQETLIKINECVERDVTSLPLSNGRANESGTIRSGYLFPEYPSRRRITVHCDFHTAARARFRQRLSPRKERERDASSGSEIAGPSRHLQQIRSLFKSLSSVCEARARENLRSRSPDGHVNNLSVRFHRRPAPPPVAPRRAVFGKYGLAEFHVPRVSPSARARVCLYTPARDIRT